MTNPLYPGEVAVTQGKFFQKPVPEKWWSM